MTSGDDFNAVTRRLSMAMRNAENTAGSSAEAGRIAKRTQGID